MPSVHGALTTPELTLPLFFCPSMPHVSPPPDAALMTTVLLNHPQTPTTLLFDGAAAFIVPTMLFAEPAAVVCPRETTDTRNPGRSADRS